MMFLVLFICPISSKALLESIGSLPPLAVMLIWTLFLLTGPGFNAQPSLSFCTVFASVGSYAVRVPPLWGRPLRTALSCTSLLFVFVSTVAFASLQSLARRRSDSGVVSPGDEPAAFERYLNFST